jgi:hypothetical protein
LFCGGDASEPDHLAHCDGRQGQVEAFEAFEPREHARTTDPDTSHAAAAAARHDATLVQLRVTGIFGLHPEGLTDEELVMLYQRAWPSGRSLESRASARKRRSDLTRMGILYDSGERRVLTSGRKGIVWKRRQKPTSEPVEAQHEYSDPRHEPEGRPRTSGRP